MVNPQTVFKQSSSTSIKEQMVSYPSKERSAGSHGGEIARPPIQNIPSQPKPTQEAATAAQRMMQHQDPEQALKSLLSDDQPNILPQAKTIEEKLAQSRERNNEVTLALIGALAGGDSEDRPENISFTQWLFAMTMYFMQAVAGENTSR
jgi:hypothetical protein